MGPNNFIASVSAFAGTFAPKGFYECNGQLLSTIVQTQLYSLIGTNFGGDGRNTFAVPDLRGRSIRGVGQGNGLTNVSLGQVTGSESAPITVENLPSHNHTASVNVTPGNPVPPQTLPLKLDIEVQTTDNGSEVTSTATLNASSDIADTGQAAGSALGNTGFTGTYQSQPGPESLTAKMLPGSVEVTSTLDLKIATTVTQKSGTVTIPEAPVSTPTVDVTVGYTGSNKALPTLPPTLGLRYIICSEGHYPTRD